MYLTQQRTAWRQDGWGRQTGFWRDCRLSIEEHKLSAEILHMAYALHELGACVREARRLEEPKGSCRLSWSFGEA